MVRCGAVSAMRFTCSSREPESLESTASRARSSWAAPTTARRSRSTRTRHSSIGRANPVSLGLQHLYGKPVEGSEGEHLSSPLARAGCDGERLGPAPDGLEFRAPAWARKSSSRFSMAIPISRSYRAGTSQPRRTRRPPTNQSTVTGLRSNTAPGGGGYNELAFDDASGKERIHMQAENALSSIVKSTESRDVGTLRKTSIGTRDVLHVGKQWELVVGQKQVGIIVNEGRMLVQVGGEGGVVG